MKTILLLVMTILCGLVLPVGIATAQPLPKIQLKPVFTGLQAERPLWLKRPMGRAGFLSFTRLAKLS